MQRYARYTFLITSRLHEHTYSPQLMEKDKRRNLSGGHHRTSAHIEDAPGWNECLATASEANVKVLPIVTTYLSAF